MADSAGPPPDPSRRRFFRQFAGELVTSAAQVVGAVAEVRNRSAAEAQALLGGGAAGTAAEPGGSPEPAVPSGFRTPFRFDDADVLHVIDQRALPHELVEVPVRNAFDGARLIRDMTVRGAPAIGQVAALALAASGRLVRNAPPNSRDQLVRTAAKHLRSARPTAVNLAWAVDRVMAVYEAGVAAGRNGLDLAAAVRAEADAIVAEA